MKSGHSLRQKCLIVAIGSLLAAGTVHGQSTVGSIYGQVPAGEGQTIVIHNTATGATREIAVGSNGRYTAAQLPVGTYAVTLRRDGTVVIVSHGAAIRVWSAARARNLTADSHHIRHLDNTGVVVMTGSPADGWVAETWAGEPIGGLFGTAVATM